MTYEQPNLGEDSAAEQSQDTQLQQEQAPPEQPQYVTQDDLKVFATELSENLRRTLQSLTDKQENRISQRIESRLRPIEEYYTKAGRAIPQGLREQIEMEELLSLEPQEEDEIPRDYQVAVDMRAQLEKRYGTSLDPADPEYKMVRWSAENAMQHVDSYEKALKIKAARESKQQPKPESEVETGPNPAKLPIIGGGQPSGNMNLEQLTARLREIQRKPNKSKDDWAEMKQLEAQIMPLLPSR